MSFPTTPLTTLIPPQASSISALAFSNPPSNYLLTGTTGRAIHLFNPLTSSLIQTFSAHAHAVSDLALTRDNATFASVGGDKAVFIWDVATAKVTRRFHGHVGRVEGVEFGGEGGTGGGGESVVISGGLDGGLRIWDLRSRGEGSIMVLDEAKDAVTSVALSPGGVIWAGSLDGRLRVYDLRAGCVDVDVLGAGVTSLTPSVVDGGQAYLVSTLDGKVRFMDRRDGGCLQAFEVPGGDDGEEGYRVRSTLGMGDGIAMSGTGNGNVIIWDVLSGTVKARVRHVAGDVGRGGKDVVSVVAWNENRKMWASGGGDGRVVVWGNER